MKLLRLKSRSCDYWTIQSLIWIIICLGVLTLLWYLSFTPGFEGHHENANALVLISLDQWLSEGPIASSLAPALSYPGENNAFIASSGVRLFSEAGTGFYTSAGAYSILLPYLVLQVPIFPLSPEILSHLLALMNVIIAAILIFVLVNRHTDFLVARYATIYFLFQPLVSQLGSHLWSWDSGWLVPWLALLVLTSSSSGSSTFIKLVLVFMTALCAGCNDHQGVVLVTAHIATMLFFRTSWSIITPTILGLVGAVLVTEISYAQIAGLSALLTSQQGRFTSRMLSGFNSVRFDILAFSAALIVAPLLACLSYGKSDRATRKLSSNVAMPFVSSLSGSLLDFILFPQWHEAHYFSLLKWAVPLTLTASLWMERVSLQRSYLRRISLLALLGVANIVPLFTRKGTSIEATRELGLKFQQAAPADHALAVMTPNVLWAPVIYHAKRNIKQVGSTDEFIDWMRLRGIQKGTILSLGGKGSVQSKKAISLPKLAEG